MPRILVVGGTGPTGERVVRRLVRKGYNVLVLTREPESEVIRALQNEGAKVREGDAVRRWTLWEALEGCDALVSCAHLRYGDACTQACRQLGVSRLIVMSSTRRFTRFPDTISEEVIAGESAVATSNLDWTIVRCTQIYGGRRDNNVTLLMDWFKKRNYAFIAGRGTSLIQPVFVEDVVDGVVAALEREDAVGHALNLAGPEPLTYRRYLTEIARAAGRTSPDLYPIPVAGAVLGAKLLEPALHRYNITAERVRRLTEDKHISIHLAREILAFRPRPFTAGLQLKAEGKAEVEAMYPAPKPE
ncbi:MAG: NAD(P)H-binding protein [Candidatus Sumerlaeia bacterium]|nr:NAD(P)H-binding protein [Candidatus Sumerlaeia bacterium]